MRDYSFLTSIISKYSRAAVLDFRTAKPSQFRKENRLTHQYQQEYCMSRTPLTLRNIQPGGLIKVTKYRKLEGRNLLPKNIKVK